MPVALQIPRFWEARQDFVSAACGIAQAPHYAASGEDFLLKVK
jgi:hypothetical protein